MPIDPRTISFGSFRQPAIVGSASFGETLSASFGYTYDPLYEGARDWWRFSGERQEGYDPLADLGDYVMYATDLVDAKSPEHMASLKRRIDESIYRRDVLARSSLASQFAAGLFDPLNLIALPLGGPTVGVAKSALRVGAGVAALQGAWEVGVMHPFDPVQTVTESLINTGAAALFGGALGGVASIPLTRRAASFAQFKEQAAEYGRVMSAMERFGAIEQKDLVTINKPDLRAYGGETDDALWRRYEASNARVAAARNALDVKNTPQNRERLEVYTRENQDILKEQGIRYLEAESVDPKNLFAFASNFFTDSGLYGAITTPFKRLIQSEFVPASVKEYTIRLAGDSAIGFAFNNILGLPVTQSVHQRAAIRHGEWVRAHDQLIEIFRTERGLKEAGKIQAMTDINLMEAARSLIDRPISYEGWLTRINEKRVKVLEFTEAEKKAAKIIDDFFRKAEVELTEAAFIGTPAALKKQIADIEFRLERAQSELQSARGEVSKAAAAKKVATLERRMTELEGELEMVKSMPLELTESFLPRFWDKNAIAKNRDGLTKIIEDWYSENPYVWELKDNVWQKRELSRKPEDVRERAEETVATIMGESDPAAVSYGYGRSKHFKGRIDIPNKLVWDYMVQNPMAIMKAYTTRVGPTLEFHNAFGKRIDDVMDDIETKMIAEGVSKDKRLAAMRDFRYLYESISGSVLKNPDSWDQKIAHVLRQAASFNYMGSSGLSAFPDMARVLAEHEIRNIAKAIEAIVDTNSLKMLAKEARLSGEAVDFLKNSAMLRLMEDLTNTINPNSFWDKASSAFYVLNGLTPLTQVMKTLDGIVTGHELIELSLKHRAGKLTPKDKAKLARLGVSTEKLDAISKMPWFQTKNGLYVANTEAWLDHISIPEIEGKRLTVIEVNDDGSPVGKMRNGRYIPAAYNDKPKTIKFDREYIEGDWYAEKPWANPKVEGVAPLSDADFPTPKAWSNFVMLHEVMHSRFRPKDLKISVKDKVAYENKINELALAELKAQSKGTQELVNTYRSALNSSILNTVMSATPADKPIIVSGTVHIPMRIARQFGMTESPKYKGYAEIQNGFLGLPFQFYNFALANVNKTIGAFAHGQLKNQAVAATTALTLGYLSVKLKTPEFAWDEMGYSDRFARAFDASGVMAMYSGLFYTGLHTSLALGGPNITGGIIQPKFPVDRDVPRGLVGIAGAGPSIGYDITAAAGQMVFGGDRGEGAKQLVRNMPFARMWFWKDQMNAMTRAWGL
jgi:hypothetical protein